VNEGTSSPLLPGKIGLTRSPIHPFTPGIDTLTHALSGALIVRATALKAAGRLPVYR